MDSSREKYFIPIDSGKTEAVQNIQAIWLWAKDPVLKLKQTIYLWHGEFMESKNGLGWKGPLKIIQSNPPAMGQDTKSGHPRSHPTWPLTLQGWSIHHLSVQPVGLLLGPLCFGSGETFGDKGKWNLNWEQLNVLRMEHVLFALLAPLIMLTDSVHR